MKFSGETLMAYSDGELDAPTRRQIEAALPGDPQMAAQLARHRGLQTSLRATFAPVLEDAVPQRLIDAARRTGLGAHQQPAIPQPLRHLTALLTWRLPAVAAIVTLLAGLLLGRALTGAPATTLSTADGRMLAQGVLATALSNQAGGTEPIQSEVVIGLSYQAKSGAYCRTFTFNQRESIAGVACRESDGWQIQALAQTGPRSPLTQYRMAGTLVPPVILGTVESTIDGSPLDAAAEADARARGWRH